VVWHPSRNLLASTYAVESHVIFVLYNVAGVFDNCRQPGRNSSDLQVSFRG
jgi:hypothetical protein